MQVHYEEMKNTRLVPIYLTIFISLWFEIYYHAYSFRTHLWQNLLIRIFPVLRPKP